MVDRLAHVVDDSICDDQENVEFLLLLIILFVFGHVVHLLKNASKVGWTVEIDVLQAVFVVRDHVIDTVDSWVEDVAI